MKFHVKQKLFVCLLCFDNIFFLTLCNQLDSDIATFSIFTKTGNYQEVKDILKQIRNKNGQTTFPSERMNDFLMKSPEFGEVDLAIGPEVGGDGTEIAANGNFIQDVFEGDIVLTLPQAQALLQQANGRKKRKVMRNPIGRWPTTIINYAFDSSINSEKRLLITAGIKHWEDNTCLTFRETRSGDHMLFVSGAGCYSNVGHVGGVQEVSLGPGCDALGVVAHEIGHILGFWHEQSRPDRDRYIKINMKNVIKNAEGNFDRLPENLVNDYGVAYDLGSAMHYGAYAFAASFLKRSIDTLDPNYQTTIGQRQHLSFIDIKQMNRVYCTNICNSAHQCQHGGYPDPSGNGFKCNVCKCPEGFGGAFCQTVGPSRSNCANELTARPEWQSLSFSGTEKDCNWLIRTAPGDKVRFEITSLDMQCGEVCKSYVGVKYKENFEQSASRFCCTGTLPKSPIVSSTNELIVLYRVDSHGKGSSSFHARFKIEGSNSFPLKPTQRPFTKRPFPNGFHQEQPVLPAPNPIPLPTPLPPTRSSFWSDWSAWTFCSDKCGGCGLTQRRRICSGTNCPGYDLQRATCNYNICITPQNDLVPQSPTMCSYPKQVPCSRQRQFGQMSDAASVAIDVQDPLLINSLPDYQGGEIFVGPELDSEPSSFLTRYRRQNFDPNVIIVNPIESRTSRQNNGVYCIRYIQYPCNSNSVWKLHDSVRSQPRPPCCSGFEQNGNTCRRRLN